MPRFRFAITVEAEGFPDLVEEVDFAAKDVGEAVLRFGDHVPEGERLGMREPEDVTRLVFEIRKLGA